MLIILVLYIIFSIHTFGLCVECPDEFVDLQGRCYHFSKDTANWLEALRKCAAMESSLLSIETAEKASIIFNQAVKLNVKKQPIGYWTSGKRVSKTRKPQFVWASTWEPFTYTSWCGGEPNNWDTDEYCVHLTNVEPHSSQACWNDRGCLDSTTHSRHPMHYICEAEGLTGAVECEDCTEDITSKSIEVTDLESTKPSISESSNSVEEKREVEKLIGSGVGLPGAAIVLLVACLYVCSVVQLLIEG